MNILDHARTLADGLANNEKRIVFAESCTAGLVSATLATVPGISNWLCGSAVVYREQTKTQWLNIATSLIEKHTAVSALVTLELAKNVLEQTPEADLAVAVTGHLGPDAPTQLDGTIYVGVLWRGQRIADAAVRAVRLTATDRVTRQQEAAGIVLSDASESLAAKYPPAS
ncbi:competence/damage inducible protein CinA [Rhodopirellula maiorica SM1]|uniref:Competence/damage inducible protein CinA n=1 Tax=Rhodopirellula maiorica SM1 TaxID=1265738 RepID=M5RRR2_9BACT|nr:nicotinamide-nucleotide amidohydrolase family protein [Rhodopirellula maiorica]EMI22033.1 competence/damage inducible protein CinA [Rhodopirellula maiorica SM1]